MLGEVEELARLGRTHVRDDEHQLREAREHPGHRGRPGEVVADGPRAAWTTHRRTRRLDQRPHLIEQRVVQVELPHLQVDLKTRTPSASSDPTYSAASGSG